MDVERLIREVSAKQAIWDMSNPLHHNRGLIHKYWKGIAKNCNTTIPHAKSKWKNLRDSFRAEFKKISRAKANNPTSSSPIASNWVWYKGLQFLENQMEIRKKIVYLSPEPSTEENTNHEDTTVQYIFKTESGENEISKHKMEEHSINVEDPDATIDLNEGENKRKRSDNDQGCCGNDEKRLKTEQEHFLMKEDDCYHFLMSLHKPLRSFSSERQMFVRFKIQELIFNEMSKSQVQETNDK